MQHDDNAITRAMQLLARLPGLGPRSAQRIVLQLLRHRDALLTPLTEALTDLRESMRVCSACGNFDTTDPCRICADARRRRELLCVVKDVADLWALERAGVHRGLYHVTGGLLSPLDGIGPEDLGIPTLLQRVQREGVQEVILALDATVEGQTTAHYIADALRELGVAVSHLAQGVPVGGELEYLDDGTIAAAFRARSRLKD